LHFCLLHFLWPFVRLFLNYGATSDLKTAISAPESIRGRFPATQIPGLGLSRVRDLQRKDGALSIWPVCEDDRIHEYEFRPPIRLVGRLPETSQLCAWFFSTIVSGLMSVIACESDIIRVRGRKVDQFRFFAGLHGELGQVMVHHVGLPAVIADDLNDGLHLRNS
jgi:hypothetical protein